MDKKLTDKRYCKQFLKFSSVFHGAEIIPGQTGQRKQHPTFILRL